MIVYLSGTYSRPWIHEEYIKRFGDDYEPYILESYYYDRTNLNVAKLIPHFKGFLLDSGAFTFRRHNGSNDHSYEEYASKYAEYINEYRINRYFELDIDNIVGYDRVLQIRKTIEHLTCKQCIPVWHPSRGKDDYINMCKEYQYIAIGGIAGLSKNDDIYIMYRKSFPWLIDIAHKYSAKIHGLGYTDMAGLQQYHFDSVDSATWVHGNRCGFLYWFDGKIVRREMAPDGHCLTDSRATAIHNYGEWLKFQKFALTHL